MQILSTISKMIHSKGFKYKNFEGMKTHHQNIRSRLNLLYQTGFYSIHLHETAEHTYITETIFHLSTGKACI